MGPQNIKTPGVYINETNAFPSSVVPVATAIPAFFGYTPQAEYEGKSYLNKPIKIRSFAEFETIFCHPHPKAAHHVVKHYEPHYYLIKQRSQPEKGDYILVGTDYYSIVPDPSTIYYLYNSIKLFFQNGGVDAYIVSVGTYGKPLRKPIQAGEQIINSHIKLDELLNGLALLKKEVEITMYICPDATLLSIPDNGTLMEAMLLQNTEMQTAISIFDVIGGHDPDPILYTNDIQTFRDRTGNNGLDYGVAYYPFIGTTVMQVEDIDYTNIQGGNIALLEPIINPATQPDPAVSKILKTIENPTESPLSVTQYNTALLNVSSIYTQITKHILAQANMLPPSGGMAGVMTTVDNQEGVWKAPANTSIVGAASLPIHLNETQQMDLNVDALSGKSINAIRAFTGRGILIWGARTLDGNSQDWRYISVRRTMIFLEQSCKLAARSFVFEPNDANTWSTVKSMISSFLNTVWREGGLAGATANDAFSVDCGLGTTMTSQDISNGIMIVSVRVAVVHPAEFIIFTFSQKMART